MASSQGAFLPPFSPELGGQQRGLAQLSTEVAAGRQEPAELVGSHRDAELRATTSIYYRHNCAVWMLLRSTMGSEPS